MDFKTGNVALSFLNKLNEFSPTKDVLDDVFSNGRKKNKHKLRHKEDFFINPRTGSPIPTDEYKNQTEHESDEDRSYSCRNKNISHSSSRSATSKHRPNFSVGRGRIMSPDNSQLNEQLRRAKMAITHEQVVDYFQKEVLDFNDSDFQDVDVIVLSEDSNQESLPFLMKVTSKETDQEVLPSLMTITSRETDQELSAVTTIANGLAPEPSADHNGPVLCETIGSSSFNNDSSRRKDERSSISLQQENAQSSERVEDVKPIPVKSRKARNAIMDKLIEQLNNQAISNETKSIGPEPSNTPVSTGSHITGGGVPDDKTHPVPVQVNSIYNPEVPKYVIPHLRNKNGVRDGGSVSKIFNYKKTDENSERNTKLSKKELVSPCLKFNSAVDRNNNSKTSSSSTNKRSLGLLSNNSNLLTKEIKVNYVDNGDTSSYKKLLLENFEKSDFTFSDIEIRDKKRIADTLSQDLLVQKFDRQNPTIDKREDYVMLGKQVKDNDDRLRTTARKDFYGLNKSVPFYSLSVSKVDSVVDTPLNQRHNDCDNDEEFKLKFEEFPALVPRK